MADLVLGRVLAEERAAVVRLAVVPAPLHLAPADAAAHDAAQRVRAGVRRGDRSSVESLARRSACTCLKVSSSISGSWTGWSDQIHLSGSFHVCLVAWPSATSLTSMSTSDLRLLVPDLPGRCSGGW